jgi:hypothetical protein
MSFAGALFTTQLRADPAAPRPAFVFETVDQFHKSKTLACAFDQAQLDLGIITPAEMQCRNSVVPVDHATAHRVIRYKQYV